MRVAEKVINIGGASGAWGDSPMAIPQLLTADVHYLMMDYLAEVTMSLLARARMKDPNAGFPPDFVAYLKRSLPEIAEAQHQGREQWRRRQSAGRQARAGSALRGARPVAEDRGGGRRRRAAAHRCIARRPCARPSTGEPLPAKLLTANAYLGALPIAAALDRGADIVITGRCADSALALGILMHEFGWKADDYDRLAAGSLVGHILECGPQSTGGVHTDWDKVPGWENIGYPIASCKIDGSFVLSKPDNTGGLIVPASVAEQVLYEVGDPAAYILPDVVADFSQVTLEQVGENRVRVSGARGYPPTSQYKVSATYQDGYRGVAVVSIVGPDAVPKAERTADALLARARMLFRQRQLPDFTATHTEVLGSESAYGPKAQCAHDARSADAARGRSCRPRGDRHFRARTGLGGHQLRAGHDGNFLRATEADAGGAAVHVLHRQGGAGRSEGADRRRRSVHRRRADAGRLCRAGSQDGSRRQLQPRRAQPSR